MPISRSRKWRPDLDEGWEFLEALSFKSSKKNTLRRYPSQQGKSTKNMKHFRKRLKMRLISDVEGSNQRQHHLGTFQFAVSPREDTDLSDSNRTPLPVQSTKGTTAAATSLRVMAVMVLRCAKYACSTSCLF